MQSCHVLWSFGGFRPQIINPSQSPINSFADELQFCVETGFAIEQLIVTPAVKAEDSIEACLFSCDSNIRENADGVTINSMKVKEQNWDYWTRH